MTRSWRKSSRARLDSSPHHPPRQNLANRDRVLFLWRFHTRIVNRVAGPSGISARTL